MLSMSYALAGLIGVIFIKPGQEGYVWDRRTMAWTGKAYQMTLYGFASAKDEQLRSNDQQRCGACTDLAHADGWTSIFCAAARRRSRRFSSSTIL